MDDWLEFSIRTDNETAEAISEIFSRFGTGGPVIEQICSEDERTGIGAQVTVKTFVPAGDHVSRRSLEEAIWHLGVIRDLPEPCIRLLPREEWAEAWKRDYQIQYIGERIVVVPSWISYSPQDHEIVITLDPGMAFGTGLHPSTRLALLAMERIWRPGAKVLDVGTGSGILAIAAAKLGASDVLAMDIDPLAVEVARENVALNAVADGVRVVEGTIICGPGGLICRPRQGSSAPVHTVGSGSYHVTVANIIAEVIIELARPLAESLAPQGQLIVSGVIREKSESVRTHIGQAGLRVVDVLGEEDWLALVSACA
jgi:ribosomal protein L11 methyltransferase